MKSIWKLITSVTMIAGASIALTACGSVVVKTPASEPVVNKTLTTKTFDKIDVNLDDADVEIRSASKPEVVYHGAKKGSIVAKVRGSELKVYSSNKVGIHVEEEPTVIIYVPNKRLSALTIRSADGDVDIDELSTDQVMINTADGDVTIRHLDVNKGKIDSTDGDVKLLNLKSKSGFDISTSDGDISVNGTNATGYYLATNDGDIRFKGTYMTNTDSGLVKRKINSRNVLRASTSDGDIKVN